MIKLFNNIYKYVIGTFFLVMVTYLCFLSYVSTSYVSFDINERTFFVSDNWIRNLAITSLFVLVLYFVGKNKTLKTYIERFNNNKRLFLIIKYAILVVIFICTYLWIKVVHIFPRADQFSVQYAVKLFMDGDYSAFDAGGYMGRYPHLNGLFFFSYVLAKIGGPFNSTLFQTLNALAVAVLFKNLGDILNELGYSHIIQTIAVSLGIFFPVLSIFSYFVYGNIIGLMFAITAVKYEIKYFAKGRITDAFLSAILIALAIMLKSNFLIYFVAMIIYGVFKILHTKNYKKTLLFLLFCLFYLCQSFAPNLFIKNSIGHDLNEGMSYWSWIAMGFQEGDRAPGWFNGYNNDSYEDAGYNTLVQSEVAKDNIKTRLNEFVEDGNYGYKFMTQKIASEWNNPTFQCFWDVFVIEEIGLNAVKMIQKYLNIVQSLILFGTVLFSLFAFNKDGVSGELILPMTFIGGLLFLAFLSEAKSQYAILYFMALIPCSIIGYANLIELFNSRKLVNGMKLSIVLLAISLTGNILSYNLETKTCLTEDTNLYYEYSIRDGDLDYMEIIENNRR